MALFKTTPMDAALEKLLDQERQLILSGRIERWHRSRQRKTG